MKLFTAGDGFKAAGAPGAVVAYGGDQEPLDWTNRYLLAFETERVVDGLGLLVKHLGAERGILCLPEEERGLRARAAAALAGREKLGLAGCAGSLPSRSAAVASPESLVQLSEAADGRPPTSVYVSCAGEIREPALQRVPLGTPLREVIDRCGGPAVKPFLLLVGGVLTGEIEDDLDTPVSPDTRSLLLLPAGHPLAEARSRTLAQILDLGRAACCGCGFCTSFCSAALAGEAISPHRIMRQLSLGLSEPEETLLGALLCRECGVCEAVCVMSLAPWRLNRVLKRQFQRRLQDRQPVPSPAAAAPAREGRRRPPQKWLSARLGLEGYASAAPRWGGELASRRVELELPAGTGLLVSQGETVRRDDAVADAGGRTIHAGIGGLVIVAEEQRLIIAAESSEKR